MREPALLFVLAAFAAPPLPASARTAFFDNGAQALQARNIGLVEPSVPVRHRGRLIGKRKHEVVEGFFKVRKRRSYPQIFADLAANTFFRLSYQKRNGRSGVLGTSLIGSPSLRFQSDPSRIALIPSVRNATVFASGRRQNYRSRIRARFGSAATLVSDRRLVSVRPNRSVFRLTTNFAALSDLDLATGAEFVGNDRFRVLTFSSMFADPSRFDASAIRFVSPGGAVTTIPINGATPRDTHLLSAPAEVGGWVELVKARGSTWNRDSPTIRVQIRNSGGLRLGVQGFLVSSSNPNDDSLSVWLEWLDAPDTIPAGTRLILTFDVSAIPPG